MKTLEQVLSVPRFNDLTLVTIHTDLNKIINNVEITETPDIANYISSHSLILTTAMYYKDKENELYQLIDSLAIIQCAGLCIKVGRFLDSIPIEIIDYANKRDVPILQIPATKPLGTILKELMSYLSETKEAEIAYALDIQRKFSTIFLNDATLQRIIKDFGDLTDVPIMLLDPFKENVATSNNWKQLKDKPETIISILSEKDVFQSNRNTTIIIDTPTCKQLDIAVYPIKSHTYFPYYLVILSPKKILYPVTEFAIDQGLMVLSFTILKNDKLYEVNKLRKSDYLSNLIDRQERSLFNEKEWFKYETDFGIKVASFYQVIYAKVQENSNHTYTSKRQEEKQKLAYEWLDHHIENDIPNAIVFLDKLTNDSIILLQKDITATKLETTLKNINKKINNSLPMNLLFSCGQPYTHLDFLAKSLNEAKIIDKERTEHNQKEIVEFYQPKGITRLLENIEKEEAKYFCQDCLKILSYPQSDMDIELRKTLKTFLDNQCEITKTANELFIHRNTVKYRIDNIEELLECKIDTPENSFKLRLALELTEP
ncbi:PucR family transcriptional regulator [Vagococcus sp. JNUCC 83]